MTRNQADKIYPGSKVRYQGRNATVLSVKLGGICGPHFRMTFDGTGEGCGGLTSYMLVELPRLETS
jgi:hypothetical protein